jgi:hypothetical protein
MRRHRLWESKFHCRNPVMEKSNKDESQGCLAKGWGRGIYYYQQYHNFDT